MAYAGMTNTLHVALTGAGSEFPLGWRSAAFGPSPVLVVLAMLGLGFFAGPIQPISAELAVDVTYPGDETAVESIQQIGGNLFSALLVPLAEHASRRNYDILTSIPILAAIDDCDYRYVSLLSRIPHNFLLSDSSFRSVCPSVFN